MLIEPLFALLLADYLRKKVDHRQVDYDIRQYAIRGRYVAIGLLILDVVTNSLAIDMAIRLCVVALMWLVYSRQELHVGRSLMFSMLPYMVASFVGDVVEAIDASFYETYKYVVDSANYFVAFRFA